MENKNKGYIFAYVNPDTDGVCSSIGYANFIHSTLGDNYLPIYFGNLNSETIFVLDYFNIELPLKISKIDPNKLIIIVDTHQRNQLPLTIPYEKVIEIIDHHPTGDENTFPNARIQNEEVGAVGTLIAEKMKRASFNPDRSIAGLIAAAIISNTLNFSAPSTSDRDKQAFTWLQKYVRIDDSFINSMIETRSLVSKMSTSEAILSDYKEFNFGNLKIGISQLETTNLTDFISRPDLSDCLMNLKGSLNLDHFFLNGIDVLQHFSIIVANDPKTKLILTKAIDAKFNNDIAKFSHILLRKKDLIPPLKSLFEKIN
jgi:manganese-dependent inorganic pyrophosphatase